MKLCHSVLDALMTVQGHTLFLGPAIDSLETEELKASYREIVQEPRDFGLIRRNLDANLYAGIGSFEADVELCFSNSKAFCKAHYPFLLKTVDGIGKAFKKALEKAQKKLEPPSASSSSLVAPAAAAVSSAMRTSRLSNTSSTSSASSSTSATFPDFEARCEALLVELERMASSTWFTSFLDPAALPNYSALVPEPMDLVRIRRKLGTSKPRGTGGGGTGGSTARYSSHNGFATDVRKMIGNFLRYNSVPGMKKERAAVQTLLHRFETLWQKLATDVAAEHPAMAAPGAFMPPSPHLKELLAAVEEGLKVPSCWSVVEGTAAAGQAAAFFMSLEHSFPDPPAQKKYRATVGRAVFFGDVVGSVVEGRYVSPQQAAEDLHLMADNTRIYWAAQVWFLGVFFSFFFWESAAFMQCVFSQCSLRRGKPRCRSASTRSTWTMRWPSHTPSPAHSPNFPGKTPLKALPGAVAAGGRCISPPHDTWTVPSLTHNPTHTAVAVVPGAAGGRPSPWPAKATPPP